MITVGCETMSSGIRRKLGLVYERPGLPFQPDQPVLWLCIGTARANPDQRMAGKVPMGGQGFRRSCLWTDTSSLLIVLSITERFRVPWRHDNDETLSLLRSTIPG